MSHHLDRLIRLAKKTGDRLIVHDPVRGNDIVMLSIDAYETMLQRLDDVVFDAQEEIPFGSDDPFGQWDHTERISFDEEHDEDNEDDEEDETDDWVTPADVMRDRYPSFLNDSEESDTASPWNREVDHTRALDDIRIEDIPFGQPASPLVPEEHTPPATSWEEEPIDDEPVFLEEPV